jgi:hypothetical protein
LKIPRPTHSNISEENRRCETSDSKNSHQEARHPLENRSKARYKTSGHETRSQTRNKTRFKDDNQAGNQKTPDEWYG